MTSPSSTSRAPAPAPAPLAAARPSPAALALHLARAQLLAHLRSPASYAIAVAFLVIQGLSFAAVVAALSDPARPAPLGEVLESHFGGTLLHWSLQLAVVAALAMRTIAEDRRAGTWEALLTAPVGEGAAVVGAWLGALLFYALLWLPTLAYLAVLAAYAPAGAAFDPGPVVTAYAGELLVGASFLAVGVAASAATSSQAGAAVTAFAALLALLVAGELPALWPDAAGDGAVAAVSRAISVRAHLGGFARGEPALAPVVLHAGLTVVALSAAATVARLGRRRRVDVAARAVATALLVAIAALATLLALRHPASLDVTAARRHSLDAATRAVLARVREPVDVTIVPPALAALDPVYAVVERTVARMARAQPALRVTVVARAGGGAGSAVVADLARAAGVDVDTISRGGAVVIARGARRRVVDLLELASYGQAPGAAPTVTRLFAEEALAEAIAAVVDDTPATVCVTTGHGELPVEPTPDGVDVALALGRLRADGVRVEPVIALAAGVPASCRALAVLGPRVALRPAEALAVAEHVDRGGAVVIAASSRAEDAGVATGAGALPATGLEPVLARVGLAIAPAVVVEPATALDLPGAFTVVDGYGDHPAVEGFARRRFTVWQWARPVTLAPAAGVTVVPLVTTSPRAWATADVAGAAAATAPGAHDLLGPLRLVVWARGARGGPVVAIGSAESLASAAAASGVGAGDLLLASILAEAAGRARPALALPDKTPDQVRLVMTTGERRAVTALCVGVLPAVFAALGVGLGWWRRRRRA